jgi:uncharacterized cupredoxin-like copper-binding protein
MSLTRKSRAAIAATAIASLTAFLTFTSTSVAGAANNASTVSVTAGKPSEFGFQLSAKSTAVGTVTFKVINKGALPHDFKICASAKGGTANACTGKVTKLLSPGASATLTYTFKAKGTYEYLCTVSGHAAGGMKGDLKVT